MRIGPHLPCDRTILQVEPVENAARAADERKAVADEGAAQDARLELRGPNTLTLAIDRVKEPRRVPRVDAIAHHHRRGVDGARSRILPIDRERPDRTGPQLPLTVVEPGPPLIVI